MKELSIEEKAKRYDEVVKKAKSLYKAAEPMSGCNVILETIFPELKESEDEKIRKWLIALIRSNEYGSVSDAGYMPCSKPHVIAWLLEKQGETFTKKDVDDAYLKGICDAKHELEKQGEKGAKGNEREIPNSEQKPAKWSYDEGNQEQDVSIQINPSEYINDMGGNGCYLKNTVQSPTWSDEDSYMLGQAIKCINNSGKLDVSTEEIEDWLKSIEGRVQLQSKQEWSEEDKRKIDRIYSILRQAADTHAFST